MKRLLLVILACSAVAFGQGALYGPSQCPSTAASGSVWNSATSLNATQMLVSPVVTPQVSVILDQTTTLTAGAVTFQGDYGDGNFVTIPATQVVSPQTGLPLTNPYTLVASTNQPFMIIMNGFIRLQLKLTTAITGSGTITPFTVQLCYNPSTAALGQAVMASSFPVVVASDQSNVPTNPKQLNGTTIDTNSGTKSAGTQRVVLATDQPALTNKLLVTPDSVALPANQSVNAAQLAGTTTDTNSGVKSAGTLRVVLATDQPALTNKLLVTPDSVALPANQSVNAAQVGGTATDTNSGSKSAGTLRVVLATDQPALTNKLLVTPDSVALPANQSVNTSQINGVTPLMGNGASGTGAQRVTIANDSTGQIALAAGSAVIGHTINDSGSTTAVTGTVTENVSQINGVTPLMGNGVTGTGSQRVTIASDNTAFAVTAAATLAAETTKVIGTARVLGNGGATLDSAPAATAPTNSVQVGGQFVTAPTTLTTGQAGALQLTAAQNLKTDDTTIGGTAIDTNSGNKSAGTQRMVIATDQPNLTTALNVALAANQSTNVAQINGVTTLMGNGVTGTGSQRVTIASDNTAFAVNSTLSAETTKVIGTVRNVGNAGAAFDAATGAAPPANALLAGGITSGATGGFLTGIPVADSFANINISTATTTLLITGVSGRHIRISSLNMIAAAADNVGIISGTGATCGTGSAAIVGTTAATGYNLAANGGIAVGNGLGTVMRTVAAGDSVCVITSAATQLSGVAAYSIY